MQQNGKEIHPLKKARLKLGYTQAMLADFAQVGEATIQRAENGKPLRPDTIQQLCDYFSQRYERTVQPDELGLVYEELQIPSPQSPEQISTLLMSNLFDNQAFLAKIRQSLVQDIVTSSENISGYSKPNGSRLDEDLVTFFESMMLTQWNSYYTGGTESVIHGLNLFLKELEKLTQIAQGTVWHHRVLRLLTLGYQLHNCVLRDRHHYPQASIAYQKAFDIAQELEDEELIASTLARQGVALVQQSKAKQAILYLDNALNIIDARSLPKLKGYILQALSEAYAQDSHAYESWSHLERAQAIIVQPGQELSFIRFNPSSTVAQKGVDSVFLGEYKNAIELINQSLKSYDPRGVSGRARLVAMKAEAHFKMGSLDACIDSAKEALTLAQAVGLNKIVARVLKLHAELQQSQWKKEASIAQLGIMLSDSSAETV
jgi:tetratricopeptide (TPR) repeat protein